MAHFWKPKWIRKLRAQAWPRPFCPASSAWHSYGMHVTRRSALGALLSLALQLPKGSRASAKQEPARWRFETKRFSPKGLLTSLAVPAAGVAPSGVAILLHGLGEAHDEKLGARAWLDRYGLPRALSALQAPRTLEASSRGDLTAERAAQLRDALEQEPWVPMLVVCPHTPNLLKKGTPESRFTAFSQELDALIAAVTQEHELVKPRLALGGCSMGGGIALELAHLWKAKLACVSGLQAAIVTRAGELPALFAQGTNPTTPLQLVTSQGDPFRAGNERLFQALKASAPGRDVTFLCPPGPHDQPWLRNVGTLEMLAFMSNRLKRKDSIAL